MRFLGIDYGTKRVGIAVSNETNEFALPLIVLPNDSGLLVGIKKIIAEKEVGQIVLGESTNFEGEPNEIMKKVDPFKKELEKVTGLPVYFESELYSSAEADRMNTKDSNKSRRSGVRTRQPKVNNAMLDASAAAIILKSYLEKMANKL